MKKLDYDEIENKNTKCQQLWMHFFFKHKWHTPRASPTYKNKKVAVRKIRFAYQLFLAEDEKKGTWAHQKKSDHFHSQRKVNQRRKEEDYPSVRVWNSRRKNMQTNGIYFTCTHDHYSSSPITWCNVHSVRGTSTTSRTTSTTLTCLTYTRLHIQLLCLLMLLLPFTLSTFSYY